VTRMRTLEETITEYLKLSTVFFTRNNPSLPLIFSAAAVSLASRMWVYGSRFWPGVFYVALIGEPGTGKSTFLKEYLKLMPTEHIYPIPVGSPEAIVLELDRHRHAYLFFDELDRLARNIKGYMAALPPILNLMYYLDEVGQVRTKREASVRIPAESYYIHAYFSGTPRSWQIISREAAEGFVRRTMVIHVQGTIPFFQRDHDDLAVLRYISELRSKIRAMLELLTHLTITVYLPNYPHLAAALERTQLDHEVKLMLHEYTQKIVAARVVANLIRFDLDEDIERMGPLTLADRMVQAGKELGVEVRVTDRMHEPYALEVVVPSIELPEGKDLTTLPLESFTPPHYEMDTFRKLVQMYINEESAPDDITLKNVERIKEWVRTNKQYVVSKSTFIKQILHTTNPTYYKAVLEVLEDAGYIKIINYPKGRRMRQYVVLDPSASICANCVYFRDPDRCPRLQNARDEADIITTVPPWAAPCEKFKLEGGD